jgi:tRNA(fMet)-specific endonuclease VapC
MICLDTNAIIGAMNVRVGGSRTRIEAALAEGLTIGLPAIALYELWYGIKKSARPRENEAALQEFLTLNIALWDFDPEDAREAGDIRAALARAGTPIGPYDVLIAAQARRRGATLVTANEREFARVPGLKTEDRTT